MSAIDARIERGVAVFRRAGDDPALLGAALLAFHGALERYLDDELRAQADMSEQERTLLDRGRLGWPARAELAGRHDLLSPQQRDQAIRATRARMSLARGDECPWTAEQVQTYGRLVAAVCGRMELVGKIDQRAERARVTAGYPAVPAWEEPPRERHRFSPVRFAITVLFLATLGAVGWVLYTQLDGPRLLRAVGALPAPTATAGPTPSRSTPTAPARRAQVIGLGGGPGWLHVTASFDSPTRAIRLAEGMEVTPHDEQQVDPNGTRWRLVEVAGYQGWIPEHNLKLDT